MKRRFGFVLSHPRPPHEHGPVRGDPVSLDGAPALSVDDASHVAARSDCLDGQSPTCFLGGGSRWFL